MAFERSLSRAARVRCLQDLNRGMQVSEDGGVLRAEAFVEQPADEAPDQARLLAISDIRETGSLVCTTRP